MRYLITLFFSFTSWAYLAITDISAGVFQTARELTDTVNPENIATFEEIVKVILAMLGGLFTNFFLKWLERKFPNLYAESKLSKKLAERKKVRLERKSYQSRLKQ